MLKNKTSEFFNSYAHDFNAIYGNNNTFLNKLINKYFRKSMKVRYLKTIEGCHPLHGKKVIDIGCGPGYYCTTLAKRGANLVLGIDFSQRMIELATQNAQRSGVIDRCEFICGDFMAYDPEHQFDYSIVMGFMEYTEEPKKVIEKVLSITKSKAFFSFPVDGGMLAWQRKLRYKKKCDLLMYNIEQLDNLFKGINFKQIAILKVSRDFFVTVTAK